MVGRPQKQKRPADNKRSARVPAAGRRRHEEVARGNPDLNETLCGTISWSPGANRFFARPKADDGIDVKYAGRQ